MKKQIFISLTVTGLLFGCAGHKKERETEGREHENIKRDYMVRDASSNTRPGWTENAELWAKEHGKDIKKYRFFSYETEPKVSRGIACNLAKANVKTDIAGEIATFIDKQLAVSQEGNASVDENNPKVRAMREFVENTLAEKVQALIHGAAIVKTYWEKRKYMQKLGAKQDFIVYTCAVFLRMPSDRLARAINEAANHVANSTDDPSTKDNVKRALKNASDNFVKAKTGQL